MAKETTIGVLSATFCETKSDCKSRCSGATDSNVNDYRLIKTEVRFIDPSTRTYETVYFTYNPQAGYKPYLYKYISENIGNIIDNDASTSSSTATYVPKDVNGTLTVDGVTLTSTQLAFSKNQIETVAKDAILALARDVGEAKKIAAVLGLPRGVWNQFATQLPDMLTSEFSSYLSKLGRPVTATSLTTHHFVNSGSTTLPSSDANVNLLGTVFNYAVTNNKLTTTSLSNNTIHVLNGTLEMGVSIPLH